MVPPLSWFPPNRTLLKARSRTPLWRSCTCSARRAGVSTTGSPRSASPSADPGPVVSLCLPDAVKLLHQEILVLIGQDQPVSAHPWMRPPEEDYRPGSTAPGPGPRTPGPCTAAVNGRLSSRPCQDDSHSLCERGQACHESDSSTLILCADEVWRGRRSDCCVLCVAQGKRRTPKHAQQEKKRC